MKFLQGLGILGVLVWLGLICAGIVGWVMNIIAIVKILLENDDVPKGVSEKQRRKQVQTDIADQRPEWTALKVA